jgi:hypothetical protein
MLKTEAEEEQPGCIRDDAAFVARKSVCAEYRNVDPTVVW